MGFEDGASGLEGAGAVASVAAPGRRGYVRFTAQLGREICARMAAGEAVTAICAGAGMPSVDTVYGWAREKAGEEFGVEYQRAKALSAREGLGRNTTYTEVTAAEICVRLAEGESLSAIARDPAMPTLLTIMHWQRKSADFAAALAIAREARAEQMADVGWEMALAATPETAFLTHVRLGHLRWRVAIASPKTHGKHKAADLPAAEPSEPNTTTFMFRHFQLEKNAETGQRRIVGYSPDPQTMKLVRDSEGPWERDPHAAQP